MLEAGALHRKPVEQSHLPFGINTLHEDAALAYLEAGQFPLRDGHLFDQELLGAIRGQPIRLQIGAERVKLVDVFAREQEAASPQAMAEGVEAYSGLPLRSFRAGGFQRIPEVGGELFL
jgi:hypothetical protein